MLAGVLGRDIIFTSFAQFLILVMSSLLVTGVIWIVKHSRRIGTSVEDMKRALITPKPTPLTPRPDPGLIERMDTFSAMMSERKELGDDLMEKFSVMTTEIVEHKREVTTLQDSVATLTGNVATMAEKVDELVTSITPNGGDTNSIGDVQMRMAKESGAWLDDPKEATASLPNVNSLNPQRKELP